MLAAVILVIVSFEFRGSGVHLAAVCILCLL